MTRLKKQLRRITQILRAEVPVEYWRDFNKDILAENIFRLSVCSIVLFVIELGLLYLDEYLFGTGFIIMVFLMASIVFIPLIFYVKKNIKNVRRGIAQVVIYAYAVLVLLFGAALTLFVQHAIDLTHVYLMAVFGVAMMLYIRPIPSAAIFAAVYAMFALSLPWFGTNPEALVTLRINTFIFNLFAWLLGRIALQSRAMVYVSRRQLDDKNRMLEDMANKDTMTGLYDHAASLRMLEDEMARARATEQPLSIIMMDIDDFKQINDTHGHQFGDDVICRIAGALRAAIRSGDIAGRYGGEEFIVILPNTDIDAACQIAGRIQSAMTALSCPRVTLSGGVSVYRGQTLNEFIRLADERLYQAKTGGKCRFVCANDPSAKTLFVG